MRRPKSAVSRLGAPVVVALAISFLWAGPTVAQTATPSASPEASTADWASVSAGGDHSCGIRVTGRLYCWGDDSAGQLGNDVPLVDQPTPVEVAGAFNDWTSVSAGAFHTCGRRANGRIYCWGDDALGQLGDGAPATDQPVPVEVAGGASNWTSVDAGFFHTCGRRANGRIYCFGFDGSGQLGNGAPLANAPGPVLVSGGATNWTSVTVGNFHTCGRRANGRIYCFGEDGSGQLGNGLPLTDLSTPALVGGGAVNVTIVAAGGAHTCARTAGKRLFCFGDDVSGQLGNGAPLADQPAPVEVAGGLTTWTALSAGNFHTCAGRQNGRLYCWGADGKGQLGNAAPLASKTSPVQVAGNVTNWRAVSGGNSHTCARRATSRIYCWGEDAPNGQLGAPSTGDQSAPVQVSA